MQQSPHLTRRQLLTGMAVGGGLFLVGPGAVLQQLVGRAGATITGPSLAPGDIPQFARPLVIPPAMPRAGRLRTRGGKNVDLYEISMRQFSQEVLPPPLPPTTVWGYGSERHRGTHNFPSFTIEAKWRAPVRVTWVNELVDSSGNPLPHLLPVDPTLHWANPPGPIDHHGIFPSTPDPYTGPVPIVTHVHGAHTTDDSDGYPEAWYLPAGNLPPDVNAVGSWYQRFAQQFASREGATWAPGSATFQYPNDQGAATLWYHDHTLGITRLNVYAGPAGFYVLRGGPDDEVLDVRNGRPAVLPGPAPALGDGPGTRYYEIPIAIQDRSFDSDGALFYPDTREFFDGFSGPYAPDSDVAPIWNPEFFGNTMVVNGRTWPYLDVEPRRYRFRLLNGCQSRFILLKLTSSGTVPPMWQIGAEGGFLPTPVPLERILMGPAERADVIVDFGGLAPGTEVRMINLGPDEPFGGGAPGVDFPVADADTTGRVMQFRVGASTGRDPSTPPDRLVLPTRAPIGPAVRRRPLALMEEDSAVLPDVGPRAAVLGPVVDGVAEPRMWMDPVTENPDLGDVEEWELHNMTMDAHPMHIHQVQFEVVSRQPMTGGPARLPEPTETGLKDTVIAYPDEITTVRARFDIPGRFVWHCHIVEHEDNEMMRPFDVGPVAP
jgi:spore coat protein A, manganese oxidase